MTLHSIVLIILWTVIGAFWGWILYRHYHPKAAKPMNPTDEIHMVDEFLKNNGIRAFARREEDGTIGIYGHPGDAGKLADLMKRLEAEAAKLAS